MKIEGSLPCSKRPSVKCNKQFIFTVKICSPLPNPELEDQSLSAVRDCLFNILVATLHIWRPSSSSVTRGRSMSWWKGLT